MSVTLKDFKLGKVLGSGGFGQVLSAVKTSGKDKGTSYAVKRIEKSASTDEDLENEIKVIENVLFV